MASYVLDLNPNDNDDNHSGSIITIFQIRGGQLPLL